MVDEFYDNCMVGCYAGNSICICLGLVGAPACGDVMKLQVEIDDSGKIVDAKFKTFGCGSAIGKESYMCG